MYLKRLDIQGFKSFPEKIKLEFNKGITAVVGPNGSGKSNIADAVRWALGEQSAKSLRGDKMEDIIFAGTQNRRPLGFAEVSVTLDNTEDGFKIPIDFSEVSVTRKMYRSGESEYFINGTLCRLKDIHELFMDTGVGKEGYSIIGQGRIDEILSAKSDDRRNLFEEAAGIVKYKNRRKEAYQKLDREKQNLIRVNDIMLELEKQLVPLKKESAMAKKFLELRDRLKILQVNLFLLEIEKIDKELFNTIENIQILQDENALHVRRKQELAMENATVKEKIDWIENESKLVNAQIMDLYSEIERNESQIKIYEEQIQNYIENTKRLNKNIIDSTNFLDTNENEKNMLQTKMQATYILIDTNKDTLQKKENIYHTITEKLSENEQIIESYKTDLIEKIRAATQTDGDIKRAELLLSQLDKRFSQIRHETDRIKGQRYDKETHIKSLAHHLQSVMENENALHLEIADLIKKSEELLREMDENKNDLNILLTKMNEAHSRHKLLSEMEREHDGFYKSVKHILKLKDSLFKDVCGAVGEVLFVPRQFETAMETALGGALQHIITKDEQCAKMCIQYLKKRNLGRATFLPLTSVSPRNDKRFTPAVTSEKGVINVAKNLVDYDSAYENIISSLLGNVLVMDHMDNAISFSKKYRYAFKIVTLDGELFNLGGSLTGGSISKKSNVFGRSREVKELFQFIEEQKNVMAVKEKAIQAIETEIKNIEIMLAEKNNTLHELALKKLSYQQDKEQTQSLILDYTQRIQRLLQETAQLDEQKKEAEVLLAGYKEQIRLLTAEAEDIKSRLHHYQEGSKTDKEEKDVLLSEITHLKINISSKEQELKNDAEHISRMIAESKNAKNHIENDKNEISRYEEKKREKIEAIQNIRQSIEWKKTEKYGKERDSIQLEENKKTETAALAALSKENEEESALINELTNRKFKEETKKENLTNRKDLAIAAMWEDYEVTLQMAKQFEKIPLSFDKLQKEERIIKNDMKELGDINIGAIEKYKNVKNEYEKLLIQKEDIFKAEENLKKIIDELTALMENQFATQFAIISENFNTVFSEMFGGGQAYLKLLSADDVLNSDIEIKAQPPGKNLQNMTLLSGGERSLTATALLFAILKMKPSPFCILDEIEAALDDVNVKRFAHYLKNFAQNTQFIVVTHRKGTMEAADVLYGVTMQELGVSKLVSVKFVENEAV